jgi:hypothetical protein
MTYPTALALCPICRVRPVSVDVEGRTVSFYDDCDECRMVRYAAPLCFARGCLEDGHTARKMEVADYAARTYRCERGCGFVGTVVEASTRDGFILGGVDADPASPSHWLVETRRAVQERIVLGAWTPARGWLDTKPAESSLAYAEGYLAATA